MPSFQDSNFFTIFSQASASLRPGLWYEGPSGHILSGPEVGGGRRGLSLAKKKLFADKHREAVGELGYKSYRGFPPNLLTVKVLNPAYPAAVGDPAHLVTFLDDPVSFKLSYRSCFCYPKTGLYCQNSLTNFNDGNDWTM
jgi:hypothetical protein